MSATVQQTLTARSPEDVLAAVPLVLGFAPEESVVMLTFEAEHTFHARLDLPSDARDRRAAAEALVGPAARHRVRRVLFVVYTADARSARACARVLVRTFTGRGIDVVDVLRSDGRRWFPLPLERSGPEGPGTPYDLSGHLFTAQAVATGRVTRSSRDELAATVTADPTGTRAVAEALEAARGAPAQSDPSWLPETVAGLAADGRPPDPAAAARLLRAVREPAGRDAAMAGLDRGTADRQLATWSALVRVAPPDHLAPVASVLAFLEWLAGDGALAWCALERAAEGDPPCSLADVVSEALEQALPPTLWEVR